MNYSQAFIDFIGALMGTFIFYTFFEAIWNRKNISKWIFVTVYIILTAVMFISATFLKNTLYLTFITICVIFTFSFLYRSSWLLKGLLSLLLMFLIGASEICTGMILTTIGEMSINDVQNNTIIYLIAVLLTHFLLYTCIKVVSLLIKQKKRHMSMAFVFTIIAFPISSILVINLIFKLTQTTTDPFIIASTFIATILLIVSNFFVFYIIETQSQFELTKQRLGFMETQVNNQMEHYQELYKVQESTRRIWHDLKNSLIAVSGYIQNNQNAEATCYINRLSGQVRGQLTVVDTGCPPFDALLQAKLRKAEELGCTIDYSRFLLPQDMKIDAMDFSVMMANLIDNAIEATVQVEPEKRTITMHAALFKGYLNVIVQNPTAVSVNTDKLTTTKKDKAHHGFGVENVRMLVEKYHGSTNFSWEDYVFTAKIVLYTLQ